MQKYTCEYRKVSDDGRIICSKIVLGDNQVSPNLCRDCPAKACNCEHLRFSLQKPSLSPIIVRWGNGHTEIWDDQPAAVSFLHSACEAKAIPIFSPGDCICCALRPFDHTPFDPFATPIRFTQGMLRTGRAGRTSCAPFDRAQGRQGRQGRPLHDPGQEECTIIEGRPKTQGPRLQTPVRERLRLRRPFLITGAEEEDLP
jgi:hypothetical protein